MKLAKRMDRILIETAFEVLVRARALEAQGKSVIHLEIGEPDFETPCHIVDAAKTALDEGWTHYGPTLGFNELREAVGDLLGLGPHQRPVAGAVDLDEPQRPLRHVRDPPPGRIGTRVEDRRPRGQLPDDRGVEVGDVQAAREGEHRLPHRPVGGVPDDAARLLAGAFAPGPLLGRQVLLARHVQRRGVGHAALVAVVALADAQTAPTPPPRGADLTALLDDSYKAYLAGDAVRGYALLETVLTRSRSEGLPAVW